MSTPRLLGMPPHSTGPAGECDSSLPSPTSCFLPSSPSEWVGPALDCGAEVIPGVGTGRALPSAGVGNLGGQSRSRAHLFPRDLVQRAPGRSHAHLLCQLCLCSPSFAWWTGAALRRAAAAAPTAGKEDSELGLSLTAWH